MGLCSVDTINTCACTCHSRSGWVCLPGRIWRTEDVSSYIPSDLPWVYNSVPMPQACQVSGLLKQKGPGRQGGARLYRYQSCRVLGSPRTIVQSVASISNRWWCGASSPAIRPTAIPSHQVVCTTNSRTTHTSRYLLYTVVQFERPIFQDA